MALPLPNEPLFFQRVAQPAVWGGQKLVERLGLRASDGEPLGETWELSDYDGMETLVRGGCCGGMQLRALLADHREALLGKSKSDPRGRFPLLVKLIDAKQDLSVQVHPPDGPLSPTQVGKTEAWYMLPGCSDSAAVIAGLRPGVEAAQLEADASSAAVLRHLRETSVQAGDCLLIDAGVPHSIRGGTLLVEIQQTSDVTFRMYDWDRVGLDGEPRETHVEQALSVLDYQRPAPEVRRADMTRQRSRLVECAYFSIDHLTCSVPQALAASEFARVLVLLDGEAALELPDGRSFPASSNQVILLPACLPELHLIPQNGAVQLLEATAL